MAYHGEDSYDYYNPRRRRPSPHHYPSAGAYPGGMLNVNNGGSLHRSRSHGHSPAPTINLYNVNDLEGAAYPPGYVPYPAGSRSRRASPRESPEGRGRSRLGDEFLDGLEGEMLEMALERRYGRSRSRGDSDASRHSPGRTEWELQRRKEELRALSRERDRKLELDRLENKWKLEQLEADRKRERADEERERHDKRIVEDWERRQRDAEQKKKEEQKRAVEEYERKQREEKDRAKAEELRLKEKLERDAREEKEKEERLIREIEEKKKKAKEKEEKEWAEFERKQKEREEKKKKEAEEAEHKLQDEMRKRLAKLGYTEQTIDIMVDEKKAEKFKKEVEHRQEDRIEIFRGPRPPTFPKVHRDYIAIETLKYYDLPWEYDRSNPDFIIIKRDMSKRETDMLFEHTTRVRSGSHALLIEPKKKEPKLAMYRRRSRSRGGAPILEKGIIRLG